MNKVFALLILAVAASGVASFEATDETPDVESIAVTWDYGSGPGRTSNWYAGEGQLPVLYEPQSCRNVFRLLSIRHEFAAPGSGDPNLSGHVFLVATMRKESIGEPAIPVFEFTQHKLSPDGDLTGQSEVVRLTFPAFMAKQQAEDWSAAGFEFMLARPAQELHNPLDWEQVMLNCDAT